MKGENYIFPFLWLHGEEEDKLREYMRVIKNSGCDAVCVESRPHPDFCGDKWWQDMDVIIDEAKKNDMKIWILDDSHFPTGFANGAAMDADLSLRRQHVYTKQIEIKPGQKSIKVDGKKLAKQIPSSLMSKLVSGTDKAAKEVFDDDRILLISAKVEGEKEPVVLKDEGEINPKSNFRVELPSKTQKVYVTFLTRNTGIHKSYMNMLDKASCRILIDAVYEPHFRHYKDEFGKTILGFFSDEPELGNAYYFFNDASIGADVSQPWSGPLEEALIEVWGPSWKQKLPLLWDEDWDKDAVAEARFTYMDLVTRLVEECFSKQIGLWCKEHGVEYIGHLIEDNNAHARTGVSLGHYFRGLSGQHMAGIDDIGGQVIPYSEDNPAEGIFKLIGGRDGEFYHYMLGSLAASMAHLQPEKKGRSMCEIFGNYGWQEGPRMEKYLADHFMVQGINHFVPHAFSPKPYPDKDCPPHFYANGHNPQYRAFSKVISYMKEICPLISDGKPLVSVGVLYHGEGEWMGEAMLDQKVTRILTEHQINFHIIPTDVFVEKDRYQTSLDDGLKVNGNQYDTLLVPYTEYILPQFYEGLEKLAEKNVAIYFVDGFPKGIKGEKELCDFSAFQNVSAIALKEVPSVVESEISLSEENKRFRFYHYKNREKEIYYFLNQNEKEFDGWVTIPKTKNLVGYDPWEKTYFVQSQEDFADKTRLSMRLRPGESRLIISEEKAPEHFYSKENQCEGSDYEVFQKSQKTEVSFDGNWKRSVCRSIDYPKFSSPKEISRLEDYAKTDKKFSGFIAYENTFSLKDKSQNRIYLEITDAGEDVEVFVNGQSLGIQVFPTFVYDLTKALSEGENRIRIEVATTLERERGANKKNQAPTGIYGEVKLYQTGAPLCH